MKRRTAALAIALTLALSLLCPAALAAGSGFLCDGDDPPLEGTCGDGLSWALDEEGTLTVSGEGPMKDFSYNDPTPWDVLSVKRVILEEGVTSVGAAAFEDGGNLTEVSLPSTLERIGADAFAFCPELALPALPPGLTAIGDRAFWACDKLTTFTVPAGVKEIGVNPFVKCHNLEEVLVEEGCTACLSVDGVLFSGDGKTLICYPLGKPNISFTTPKGVETIGPMAFFAAEFLQRVILSEGVARVCQYAFNGSSVARLALPLSLKQVDPSSIDYCDWLTSVWYAGTREQWEQISIGEENNSLLGAARHYGDGQEEAGSLSSGNCGKSSQVFTGKIPPDWSVFWADTVTWTLDSQGTLHITGAGSLCETPQITYQSRYFVASPWWDIRDRIRQIDIGEGVTYLMFNNFRDFSNLESVLLPASLKGINKSVFYNCSSLTDVYYRGTEAQWKQVEIRTETDFSSGNPDKSDQYIRKATVHYEAEGLPEPTPLPEGELSTPRVDGRTITVTASVDRPGLAVFAVYDSQERMIGLRRVDLEEGEVRVLTFSPDDLDDGARLQGEGGTTPTETVRILLLGQSDWKPLCAGKTICF